MMRKKDKEISKNILLAKSRGSRKRGRPLLLGTYAKVSEDTRMF